MQRAFAEAGRVLDRDGLSARGGGECAILCWRQMEPEGRLLRTWRDGQAKIERFWRIMARSQWLADDV